MSDMKCPFCHQELHKDSDGYYTCYTDNCGCMIYGGNGASGSESLWLALIDSMKEHDLCHDALVKQTKELDRTQKALYVAKDTFNWIDETYRTGQETEAEIWGKVQLAAQEITALEQKDVK